MRKRIIGTSSMENGSFFKDRFFVCLFSLFCAGVIVGAAIVGIGYNDSDSLIIKICQENFSKISEESALLVFLGNILSCLTYSVAIYLFGVCAIGLPFLFVIPFIVGIGKGAFLGFILVDKNLGEVLRSIIFFLPQNIVFCFVVLAALNLAVKMSIHTFGNISGVKYEQFYALNYKKYNQRFLLYALFLVFYCVIDAVLMRFY